MFTKIENLTPELNRYFHTVHDDTLLFLGLGRGALENAAGSH